MRRGLRYALLIGALAPGLRAGDWPTFRHDHRRSGATDERIDAASLRETWTWRSPAPPRPAWAGPAKWDAFHAKTGLSAMRDYDLAFQPIVAAGIVYVGSSSDDAVHAFDARTGDERWIFPTGGPIRIAPAVADGRLYVGSDDGFVYSLDAEDGSLIWRFTPAPDRRLLLHDGALISFWPCRTGVLVDGGTAYFAASLLPWKETYLCALDAETGRLEGAGRFVRRHDDLTCEGAFAASEGLLLSPQGRAWLLAFDRSDGLRRADVQVAGGGCFVMATDDGKIAGGSSARDASVSVADLRRPKEKIISHGGARAMAVAGPTAFLMADASISAIERATNKRVWITEGGPFFALIVAGDVVFAGGKDEVRALAARDGAPLWRAPVAGEARGLAAADGALIVTTTEGAIHCFRAGAAGETAMPAAGAPAADKQAAPSSAPPVSPDPRPVPLPPSAGPCLRFTGPGEAVVRWETEGPSATVLEYGIGRPSIRVEETAPKTSHEAILTGLRRNEVYTYIIHTQVDEKWMVSPPYECDTFFNFTTPALPDAPGPAADSDPRAARIREAAGRILARAGEEPGIALVLGMVDGRWTRELARRSRLRVIGVDTDAARVERIRRALIRDRVYGDRIRVLEVASLAQLPLPDGFARAVVSESMLDGGSPPGSAAEIARILRPLGGTAILGRRAGPGSTSLSRQEIVSWLEASKVAGTIEEDEDGGLWAHIVRADPLPGAGDWTHQYARADNATTSGDRLQGARGAGDLEIQWLGRPGPRFQPDRNGRKPSPLSTRGKLFVQGHRRIAALDAYSGTFLWSIEIPDFLRMNMPRDCGNWCADDAFLYAAVRDRCWQIDAATGEVARLHPVVAGARADGSYDWGYIARDGEVLVGSAVKRGAAYTNFWGGDGWYDGNGFEKVVSETLFALDARTGELRWRRAEGLVIHSTIAISGGRIVFIESRKEAAIASESRRTNAAELWEDPVLVALDAASGARVWERTIRIAPGIVMVSLAAGAGKIVIVSSAGGKYAIHTFEESTGEPAWTAEVAWYGGDHGLHMARPVILGGRLHVSPAIFDLATGAKIEANSPGGRCGTTSASADAIFYRWDGVITMWDATSGKATRWPRLRPDCWLSVIPASGMVLAPEGGGGCWCSVWLETSTGFAPPAYPRPTFAPDERRFVGSMEVRLAERRDGSVIRYTLDGSEPAPDSTAYVDPIRLTDDTTIKARAFWAREAPGDWAASDLASAEFIRTYPPPSFGEDLRLFAGSRRVEIRKEDPEGAIHYTLDGSEPTPASPRYEGPFSIAYSATIRAGIFYASGKRSPVAEVAYEKWRSIEHQGKTLQPGLRYEYYEEWMATLADLTKFKPISSGLVGNFSLSPRKRNDGFAIRYAGFIDVPEGGEYTFHIQSDDGSKLSIDGRIIADNDGIHDARGVKSGKIALEPGAHAIEVLFFECTSQEYLGVAYEGPGIPRQPIPDKALYSAP